jgi:hypothetical protein
MQRDDGKAVQVFRTIFSKDLESKLIDQGPAIMEKRIGWGRTKRGDDGGDYKNGLLDIFFDYISNCIGAPPIKSTFLDDKKYQFKLNWVILFAFHFWNVSDPDKKTQLLFDICELIDHLYSTFIGWIETLIIDGTPDQVIKVFKTEDTDKNVKSYFIETRAKINGDSLTLDSTLQNLYNAIKRELCERTNMNVNPTSTPRGRRLVQAAPDATRSLPTPPGVVSPGTDVVSPGTGGVGVRDFTREMLKIDLSKLDQPNTTTGSVSARGNTSVQVARFKPPSGSYIINPKTQPPALGDSPRPKYVWGSPRTQPRNPQPPDAARASAARASAARASLINRVQGQGGNKRTRKHPRIARRRTHHKTIRRAAARMKPANHKYTRRRDSKKEQPVHVSGSV